MKLRLKRLLEQPLKRKEAIVLVAIVLVIFMFGGIYALRILDKASKDEKVIHSQAENIRENGNVDVLDKNSQIVEELPFITFKIDTIEENEAVFIGKIEIENGSIYEISASVDSGEKIFVALYESDDIKSYKGIVWKQYRQIIGTEIEAQFTDMNTGTYYVYIGNTGSEPLINVNGSLNAKEY
ncbi:MAG: hypothetical protein GX129_02395 [Clostridiales bacterium]|nr:hypothetical protein [Clostridiales bacterium]